MTKRVVITTSWLQEGDAVHQMLEEAGHEVVYGRPVDLAACGISLQQSVADADGVIAGVEPFDASLLAAAPRLVVIARTGAGYDNVDLHAAHSLRIAVCATPGANRRSVAEFTVASLLNLLRAIPQNSVSLQSGRWEQPSGRDLNGKALGIVGLGAIGKTVAQLAKAFGMRVSAYDPQFDAEFADAIGVTRLSFDDLLATSDAVTLHLSLSGENRHLIDSGAFGRMKPGAVLVNAARGELVDERALAEALRSGTLAGAAMDTFEREPLPPDSVLRHVPNLQLTAHIAGATVEGRARSGEMAARSVIDALAGLVPEYQVATDHPESVR